jgi:hypothetical protein
MLERPPGQDSWGRFLSIQRLEFAVTMLLGSRRHNKQGTLNYAEDDKACRACLDCTRREATEEVLEKQNACQNDLPGSEAHARCSEAEGTTARIFDRTSTKKENSESSIIGRPLRVSAMQQSAFASRAL